MESQSGSKIIEDGPGGKDYLSGLVTSITVLASLLTIAPFAASMLGNSQPVTASSESLMRIAPVEDSVPCVLESSSYTADVSGYLARVTVKQKFRNPNKHKVDANYAFPLSDRAAVDEMSMQIGGRNIKGQIKESEEARRIYEQARAGGYTATLLDQVRTNIFSQAVANIEPGKSIDVTIKYTELLPYSKGKYSLVLPTKIGGRFIPSNFAGDASRLGSSSNVNDRSNVHVAVSINEGGIPISKIDSPTHLVQVNSLQNSTANVSFDEQNASGKDIVIDWKVASGEMQSGYLTHKDGNEGFFTAMIMPPKALASNEAAPKEMIFVVDCSGSQAGTPLQKAKDTLDYIVDHMNPRDSMQIIAFNSSVAKLAPEPVQVSADMKRRAHEFIGRLNADGGTVMAPAIEEACNTPSAGNRLRIVTLMTDGYIGNDYEIIGMVKRLRGKSRWFPFGTGDSVNRTLIDGVAKEGGGEPEFVLLNSSSKEVAERFYNRISSPVLTDVRISSDDLELQSVYPRQLSDVWEERPLYFQAKYKKAGRGTVVLSGLSQGKPYRKVLQVVLPEQEKSNSSISQIWARQKIDDLMSQDWLGAQNGTSSNEIKDDVIKTSLAYHVLSQYTSFVAVDSDANKASLDNLMGKIAEQGRNLTDSNATAPVQLPTLSLDFGLSQAISQSFSTTVNQLNRLNASTPASGNANYFPGGTGNSSAPMLQGATNGCIGPQGSDASVIQGVNTAGTVSLAAPSAYNAGINTGSQLMSNYSSSYTGSMSAFSSSPAMVPPPPAVSFSTNPAVAPVSTAGATGSMSSGSNQWRANIHNLVALAQYFWLLAAGAVFLALTLKHKLSKSTRYRLWLSVVCFTLIAFNLPGTILWMTGGV